MGTYYNGNDWWHFTTNYSDGQTHSYSQLAWDNNGSGGLYQMFGQNTQNAFGQPNRDMVVYNVTGSTRTYSYKKLREIGDYEIECDR